MAGFDAKDVQRLRQEAGVGMMDAKRALADAGGDMEKAFELLRERGQAKMAKRTDREANEGVVGSYVHTQNNRPVLGVLVELVCETDFVAKSEEFVRAANSIALHCSWADPRWITRDQVDTTEAEKERDLFRRQADGDGKPPEVVERIVAGKMESWYAENVLYDQTFVNPEIFEGTVGDMVGALASKMGENISVRRIARVAVGS
ncbi:MAG: elongation factor Ts [Actinobacteria bacterium]|nr:elongation factor Ts [Actinomycetota bacterium]MCI0543083.1 elongation factor Ts [Actinomycetota bacterium]MCI0677638.1 elongation factor Ts [Actinomycetota bacterium]